MSKLRHAILETLGQRGALPIAEIAQVTRRSVLATRYHLNLLINDELISAQVTHTASVGRPQVLYALADSAHEQLPKNYNDLAVRLLDQIGDALGEKETRGMLRRAGKRLAQSAPPLRRGARAETRLDRAINFLTARGYMARWEKLDKAFVLDVCNCPYRRVALEHRQVCELDLALIGELLDAPMKMSQCIANRDGKCTFIVKPKSAK